MVCIPLCRFCEYGDLMSCEEPCRECMNTLGSRFKRKGSRDNTIQEGLRIVIQEAKEQAKREDEQLIESYIRGVL